MVSYYNTIPLLQSFFLYAFLENLTIDLPSIMVTTTIEIHHDPTEREKLIYPSFIS